MRMEFLEGSKVLSEYTSPKSSQQASHNVVEPQISVSEAISEEYFEEQSENSKTSSMLESENSKTTSMLELSRKTVDLKDALSTSTKQSGPPLFTTELYIDIVKQILEGVKHLHDIGIIHQDIKPENILIRIPSNQGIGPQDAVLVKIIDFGLSKATTGKNEERTGTPSYMTQELFNKEICMQNDIFAVGLTALQLVMPNNDEIKSTLDKYQHRNEGVSEYKEYHLELLKIASHITSDRLRRAVLGMLIQGKEERLTIPQALGILSGNKMENAAERRMIQIEKKLRRN